MDHTPNLALPYLAAAQAQKHVTHNEALLRLDAVVQIGVTSKALTMPPASPLEAERYIPAPGATGAWAGKDGQIAAFQDGAWMFHPPRAGWLAWVADEQRLHVHDGSNWAPLTGSASSILNTAAHGAQTIFDLTEEELTLSGSLVDSSIVIPDRAIVFAVSCRTTEAITGASSYDCGIDGERAKYGGSLGIAAGSTNSGVTGPTAYYADTPIRITANGGNFTGGKVRIAIHAMRCPASTS